MVLSPSCAKLGVAFIYKDQYLRYTFRVGSYYDLIPSTKTTVTWVMRNIHGMKFEDGPGDLAQEDLTKVLQHIQAIGITESGRSAIGYKGGHIERDALRKACIPHYNIEDVGCPTYNKLFRMYDVISAPTCGLHCYCREGVTVHCPVAETALFRKWLLDQ